MFSEAAEPQPLIETLIHEQMERNVLDYAMSVIVDRAVPDVRDGVKPVHRRILYAMRDLGYTNDKPTRKSVGVVGDVLKLFHPHSDSAVYQAAVRLAQDFTLLHPLIDPHGNFGDVMGNEAAAYRYTEMKLSKMGQSLTDGIARNLVDFVPNFDGTKPEPTVLPVFFPHLLVNGSEGIAVTLATSIPPHNLGEVINAYLAYIDDPDIDSRSLLALIPGPDFPTGGIVHGMEGFIEAIETGRGSVKLRGTWREEERRGGSRIILDSIPYRVNLNELYKEIAALADGDKEARKPGIDEISAVHNESNHRNGIRVVIDIKAGASADVIVNQIIAQTSFEVSVPYNVNALVPVEERDERGARKVKPRQLGFREVFAECYRFGMEMVVREATFDLAKARERLHLLVGFIRAIGNLDETIRTIREAESPAVARPAIMALLAIDVLQADAILAMKLQQLTGLELDVIRADHAKTEARVADLVDFIASPLRQREAVKARAEEVGRKFSVERRTEVTHGLTTLKREDLIDREDVIVVITADDYVKRIPVSAMNKQNRGTRGKSAMATREGDMVVAMHTASTHDLLLAFTSRGYVHAKKVFYIDAGTPGSKGRHLRNVLDDYEGEIVNIFSAPDFSEDRFLVTVSKHGSIKRTPLSEYVGATKKGGVIAVKIDDGDEIVAVDVCREHDHIIVVGSNGKAIRFIANGAQMRPMGRNAVGTRAMTLPPGESVVGMVVVHGDGNPQGTYMAKRTVVEDGQTRIEAVEDLDTRTMDEGNYLLCMGQKGVGKRTRIGEFSAQSRGGKGVVCFKINGKTGPLVRALNVRDEDDLIPITEGGRGNRIAVDAIRSTGRDASGVIIVSLEKGDRMVSAVRVVRQQDEPGEAE